MSIRWDDGRVPIVGEYLELIEAAGLGRRSAAAAGRGLAGGLHCVTARDGARLVGVGRIVGDGGLTVTLVDIAVHPDWQGQGLGTEIVSRLVAWCDDTLPRGCIMSLLADPGSFALYQRAGFEIRTGMIRRSV